MATAKRVAEVNQLIESVRQDSEFSVIPNPLVHAVIQAETSYSKKQYYRHEPKYWFDYMAVTKDLWVELYKYQYGNQAPSDEEVSKKYSASYGIMQTMFDIAVAIHLKYNNFPDIRTLAKYAREGSLKIEDYFEEMELPEEISADDEVGIWYGCSELIEKMNSVFGRLVTSADRGQIIPGLPGFLNDKQPITISGKAITNLDFCKFVISSYQAGVGTIGQLFSQMKTDNVAFTWENASKRISLIRGSGTTELMIRHIVNAFDGLENKF